MKARFKTPLTPGLILLIGLSLTPAQAFQPDTPQPGPDFTVNSTLDSADGICGQTNCSLREAVIAANTDGVDNIITLPAGTYTLSIPDAGFEQDALTGDLDALDSVALSDLTINGSGVATTTIDATALGDRIFHNRTETSDTFTLTNVTLTGGNALTAVGSDPLVDQVGGGLFNGGAAILQNVVLTGNQAPDGGVAVFGNTTSRTTIINSAITGNTISSGNATVLNYGDSMTVSDSVISDNATTAVSSVSGTTTITRTTISGNSGSGVNSSASVTIRDSLLKANSASAVLITCGSTQIINTTISGNTATAGAALEANTSSSGCPATSVTVAFSTLANNTATTGSGAYISGGAALQIGASILENTSGLNCATATGGTITSLGYNITRDDTSCTTFTGTGDLDLAPADPLIAALASNGGPTETHALQFGSPAINAIPADVIVPPAPPSCTVGTISVTADQRGTARPYPAGYSCDPGAFELTDIAQPGPIFTVNSTLDFDDGACGQTNCSLREAIRVANVAPDANTIRFIINSGGLKTIAPKSVLPAIIYPIILDGTTQQVPYAGTPLIELDGSLITGPASGLTITTTAGNSTVRGLIINKFPNNGIRVESTGNIIEGNVISGNGQVGILVVGNSNQARGNWIGLNAAGTAASPNGGDGIRVESTGNIIGGNTSAQRNIISGNAGAGILFFGNGNQARGNWIGLNAAGNGVVSGQTAGILVQSDTNTVGGATAGMGNVVSGNGVGIRVSGQFNLIQGNSIGTDGTGAFALGNTGAGILLSGSSNTTGGTIPGTANLITASGGAGIAVTGTATNNKITVNSIFDNTGMGIDLNDDGITTNDPNDPDTGPNGRQNFPVLNTAYTTGVSLTINGTLNSKSGVTYRVEYFNNLVCDPSGNGEGRTYLGFSNITTAATGNGTIALTLNVPVLAGGWLAATATDNLGATSEFSACVLVQSLLNTAPLRNYFTTPVVTLTWNRISGASNGYEIQVARDVGFTNLAFPAVIVPSSQLSHSTPPLADGFYYWRVRGLAGAPGPWGKVDAFVVDAP